MTPLEAKCQQVSEQDAAALRELLAEVGVNQPAKLNRVAMVLSQSAPVTTLALDMIATPQLGQVIKSLANHAFMQSLRSMTDEQRDAIKQAVIEEAMR
ncbi:MAG: hypothetical protein AAF805_00780 [Planctomycetota bacterium]